MSTQRSDTERWQLMAVYQQDPTPQGGYQFWRLAMPDIEAAFWTARQQGGQATGGPTT